MKKVQLFLSLLLVTTFLSPVAPTSHAAGVTRFSDISSKHWAQQEIELLHESKLIGGYSDQTFRPNNPITRAEAVKIIVEANHIEIDKLQDSPQLQSDVPASYWASPYIEAAQQHHLITGYADGSFRPEATLTRADSAVLIARSFNLSTPTSTQLLPTDIGVDHWAAPSINKLVVNGVAEGDKNGKFQPSKMVTRSEFAALLARTLYKELRVDPASASAHSSSKGSPGESKHVLPSPTPSPSPSPSPSPLSAGSAVGGGGSVPAGDSPTTGGASSVGGSEGMDSQPASGDVPQPPPLPSLNPSPLATPTSSPDLPEQEISALESTSDVTSLKIVWTNPQQELDFKEVRVYKEGIKVGTTSGTSYEESGLSPSTTYIYTLRTVDLSNHESKGTVISVTTAVPTPPSSPTELVATPKDGTIQLQWEANTEGNISGYNVYAEGLQYNIITVTQATYTLEGLKNGKNYNVYVTAMSEYNMESEPSASLDVVPMPEDFLAPEEVNEFNSTNTGTAISMAWSNPSDVDFKRVDIYQGSVLVGNSTNGTYDIQGLQSETDYEFLLKTVDTTGNVSNGVSVSIKTNDITPPAMPAQVKAEGGPGIISLSWLPNEEKDLVGYNVYVNGSKFNNVLITEDTYELAGLNFGEIYSLQLEAADSSKNVSAQSPVIKSKITHYLIEQSRWGIYNDGTHPVETTQGINNALIWANLNKITAVWLSSGDYLIDKNSRINMVANMLFELPGNAVLQKETNSRERYDVLYVGLGKNNVTLKGGVYRGDKDTHDYSTKDNQYSSGTHEGGHGITIEGAANITVDGVKSHNFTGDGLVLGGFGTLIKDVYNSWFIPGSFDSSGQVVSSTGKMRTKTPISLVHPIFQIEDNFEVANFVNLPNDFEIYYYKADGTFIKKQAAVAREKLTPPDQANYFYLVFNQNVSTGAYLEVRNRAVTRNAVVKNSEFAFNRRQGITVGGADNILITGNTIHDMRGTAPQSGIDVEGGYSQNGHLNTNINIVQNEFYNNASYDVILYDGYNAKVDGNHMASSGAIGLAISKPFNNSLIQNNFFDGSKVIAYHDATLLNNRMRNSSTFFTGPNLTIDGFDVTNGKFIVDSISPFAINISNLTINITGKADAGLLVRGQPLHFKNVTIQGEAALRSLTGTVAAGSIFDNLQMLNYNSMYSLDLIPATYNNAVFTASAGSNGGMLSVGAGKYVFNNSTFTSNAAGSRGIYGDNALLDLTVKDSTFNVLGNTFAISIQAASKVVLENNTINALNISKTTTELIKINDAIRRLDPADVMNVVISGNVITANIAAVGISTVNAGTNPPIYSVQNNTLTKATLLLKVNDSSTGNILN